MTTPLYLNYISNFFVIDLLDKRSLECFQTPMVLILALNHHGLVRFFCILFKISIFKPNAKACLFKPLLFNKINPT
ncbi:hypothetical protein HMPREF1411_00383 [Helicobacter pylori GAM250AFi]|nr:hypothetical protein HMPREF1411_00383 [Helicobacter pylori GAM250AFi]EMH13756.1 hypothetical protein HMPREF1412_00899 [Helicobacter pylori GAM250T]EMH13945.1 hypothetical protein HMPREF1413_01136 [Helicobacter pylori GAM252Bi]EMH45551.1 hypothetical protein HMPREF1438_01590 [Helicobacter pylori HP250AFii]EMH46101.1 hypothetical protein HMPREF1439_01552 [Helicobacter pylori HP250AFiii]EMH50441.1 hypothetical protein HMPREF1440_01371 [Helicobacter pylori HP250AFiV]EMH56093.1 hypothetical pro